MFRRTFLPPGWLARCWRMSMSSCLSSVSVMCVCMCAVYLMFVRGSIIFHRYIYYQELRLSKDCSTGTHAATQKSEWRRFRRSPPHFRELRAVPVCVVQNPTTMSINIPTPLKRNGESGAQTTLNYWISANELAGNGEVRYDYRRVSAVTPTPRYNGFVSEGDL